MNSGCPEFSDTGEGIAEDKLPHIFDRFYRIGDSRARSEGGTGLGLAIVKQMAQAHGGCVWVESEPGKGSTFLFHSPWHRFRNRHNRMCLGSRKHTRKAC